MSSLVPLRRSLLIGIVLSAVLIGVGQTPAFAVAPANDNFGAPGVPVLTGESGTVNGTTVDATQQGGEPDHAGAPGGRSVWYRWTPPSSGAYTFNTCTASPSLDTVLAIYTGGTVSTLNEIASDDDGCGGFGGSIVTFSAVSGTQYRIVVDGYDATQTGTFTLAWQKLVAPGNDLFGQAQALTGTSGSVSGSNVGASKQPNEPDHAMAVGGASIWYKWTAPEDGDATFETCGSNFDTVLAVYEGVAVDDLTEVGSDDDSCGSGSRVVFLATGGTEYRIAVDSLDSSSTG
ncbi:MAG TPA: hypothetical protein VM121_11250, partial [Acidimicrobiales bacterium]|nr:hypothetical protein [Acidimicrobiales bacterium]